MTDSRKALRSARARGILRFITVSRILLLLVVLLLLWVRLKASGMSETSLPESLAHPFDHPGGTLMTYQSGEGRPVIFVHGTPGQADNWAYFLQNPRTGIRAVAIDRPGFGASTPEGGYRWLKEEAAALRPLLDSFRGQNPILVGHSLGGPIIAQAALDYPDLVGGLVMVAASMDPSVEKVYAIQYLGDLPCVGRVLPRVLRNSNQELIPLREDLERLFPRLGDIECPVRIIHGTEDMLVPFENVAYMKAAFSPNILQETIALDGENHFLPWTAQETIWQAAEALAEQPARQP